MFVTHFYRFMFSVGMNGLGAGESVHIVTKDVQSTGSGDVMQTHRQKR